MEEKTSSVEERVSFVKKFVEILKGIQPSTTENDYLKRIAFNDFGKKIRAELSVEDIKILQGFVLLLDQEDSRNS